MNYLSLNLNTVAPFPLSHLNYLLTSEKDAQLSDGNSYHHQCVLDTDGIIYTCSWLHLEPEEDAYDVYAITRSLNYAASHNKPVIIRIFYKSYSDQQPKPLPDCILNDHTKYGGVAGSGGLRVNQFAGYTPRFDNPYLIARFHKLIDVIATATFPHSALQGASLDESAWSFGGGFGATGLTAAQIVEANRANFSHLQSRFLGKEMYAFINYYEGSTQGEVLAELDWAIQQGMLPAVTDTFRRPEMESGIQPVEVAYPLEAKTLMCVDFMSMGPDDSGLKFRMLENAMTTSRFGADITGWYNNGGASSNYWAAIKNAITLLK